MLSLLHFFLNASASHPLVSVQRRNEDADAHSCELFFLPQRQRQTLLHILAVIQQMVTNINNAQVFLQFYWLKWKSGIKSKCLWRGLSFVDLLFCSFCSELSSYLTTILYTYLQLLNSPSENCQSNNNVSADHLALTAQSYPHQWQFLIWMICCPVRHEHPPLTKKHIIL